MPYIKAADRELVFERGPTNAGELNFLITTMVLQYMCQTDTSYARINEVVGVLECCKLELYRRLAAPYEDLKIQQNGDVYD